MSEKVLPIVEPVTASPSLVKTIDAFIKKNREIGVVVNPKVGDFFLESEYKDGYIKNFFKLFESPYCVPVHLIGFPYNNLIPSARFLRGYAIVNSAENIEKFNEMENSYELCFIPDSSIFKYRLKIETAKVLFENHFNKLERNSDYAEQPDEFYSADHLYYRKENYFGFSDYSIVGSEYSSSGFAPYAVVIHIVYFDENHNMRIHHYVSDSNSDISNTPGKFKEALDKLIVDEKIKKLDTLGIRELKNLYENGKYPGLGYIKKLSIMHHLQLVSEYLMKEIENDFL